MKICKNCIQPDTRPGIFFDKNQICGSCLWHQEKHKINWLERERELKEIAVWAKQSTKSNYDCVIGVSGGKDSTKQAIIDRDKLGGCFDAYHVFSPNVYVGSQYKVLGSIRGRSWRNASMTPGTQAQLYRSLMIRRS